MKKRSISDFWLRLQLLAVAAAVLAVVLAGVWLWRSLRGSYVQLGVDDTIGLTPTQLTSLRDIGEWEFLAISDEELVDTVRKGLLSDDHLVRIYYGTLRLGIDTRRARQDWLSASGDTVDAVLPRVGLLSEDFIDEARTKAFYESGRWTAADREAMYRKAYRQMRAHCLTAANLQTARDNAEVQVREMLRALGYRHITLRFE